MEFIYSVQGNFKIEIKVSNLVFIEALISSFLHIKGLYPPEAFVSKNLFGIQIKSIGENTLKDYVHEFIRSIEDIHNKGILHSISIIISKENSTEEIFTFKINWALNLYSLSDLDKAVSPTELDSVYSSILLKLYDIPEENHSNSSFQIIVETIKEEMSEDDEVLTRENWQLVSKDEDFCNESVKFNGIAVFEWGLSSQKIKI